MKTKSTAYTPGPWAPYHLNLDHETYGDRTGKCIVTAQDGDVEICGVVPHDADALLIAHAPALMDAADRLINRFDCLMDRWDRGIHEIEDQISEMARAVTQLEKVRNEAIGLHQENI